MQWLMRQVVRLVKFTTAPELRVVVFVRGPEPVKLGETRSGHALCI